MNKISISKGLSNKHRVSRSAGIVITFILLWLPRLAWPTEILLPASGLQPNQLAIVVNERDPLSKKIAAYYQQQRGIPSANMIYISFDPGHATLSPAEFAGLYRQVIKQTIQSVQAYALTWAEPYRVGCMSISSAFALGYNARYCASGCKPTSHTLYGNSASRRPYDDFSVRPTMLLAAKNFSQAKQLIDRGVAADGSAVTANGLRGSAYLVATPDKNRSVRKVFFPYIEQQLGAVLNIRQVNQLAIRGKSDVMFYFTGAVTVPAISSNTYLPGAIADHLTSTGGQLTNSRQMSALRWLEAGATGSYGTVVEPCNLLTKFPNPLIAITKYMQGETLLEAYWKSVLAPGQGVFIGEPLASPYAGYHLLRSRSGTRVRSPVLTPGYYKLLTAEQVEGPFRLVQSGIKVTVFQPDIVLPEPLQAVYKIERLESYGALPWRHLLN